MTLIDASVERVRAGDNRHDFEVIGPASLLVDRRSTAYSAGTDQFAGECCAL